MGMPRLLRENALSFVMLGLFLFCMVGQTLTGHAAHNEEAVAHGQATLSLAQYVTTGAFIEAIFENWESEFLQMALLVLLTKFLRQKGSSESKPFDSPAESDEDPRLKSSDPQAPWPVRRGGWILKLYEHSLSAALALLFLISFGLHAYGGQRLYNEEQKWHGEQAVGFWRFVSGARFWEESFQNWQSEFLSVAVLVLLSIVLRERGSSQSKPVAAPHSQTGE